VNSTLLRSLYAISAASLIAVMLGCGSAGQAPAASTEADATPSADPIGEALVLDTRFGEFFAANMTGVNTPLTTGDPAVNEVETTTGTLPGPFAGQAINCRSCHFVTEFQGVNGAGPHHRHADRPQLRMDPGAVQPGYRAHCEGRA
jgi:hypothetical protein